MHGSPLAEPVFMKKRIGLSVLFAAASAHAQPSQVEAVASSQPPSPTQSRHFELESGVVAGTDAAMAHQAIFVGGEYAITPVWRLHAQYAWGRANNAMAVAPDAYASIRSGVDARLCASHELCMIAGLDAALVTESYATATGLDGGVIGTYDELEGRSGFAAIPRLALDVGSRHLRFRPGVEATLSTPLRHINTDTSSGAAAGDPLGNRDLIGLAVTGAVAYEW